MNLETYISEFSKYVIALIMALYALVSIELVLRKKEEKKNGAYLRQNILMFAFHFSCFMVICFETGEVSFLVFYAFQQIVLYVAIVLYKLFYPKSNRMIVNNMCMFLSVSFVILTRLGYTKAVKQFIIASASLIIALIIPFFIRYLKLLKNLKWVYAILGVLSLGTVMILGQTTYGSKISYTIGGMSFQPAEIVKVLFVFFLASSLYEAVDFLEIFTSAIIAGLHVVIQVVNKDLGSALIFSVVYICMLYISTQNIIFLLLGMGAGSGAAYVAFKVFDHVKVRVQAWKDPWSVIDSAGYQITQSLFGITSGGYFGLGLYKGSPNSIPFVEDDFIFSALTEEFGLVFAIALLIVCLMTFVEIMKLALKLKDTFYQLIASGLGITYIFQVFLTVGGGTKFIPLTGVTLPLISYGGTSILTTIIMFAIIEGLSMISKDESREELALSDNNYVAVKARNNRNVSDEREYIDSKKYKKEKKAREKEEYRIEKENSRLEKKNRSRHSNKYGNADYDDSVDVYDEADNYDEEDDDDLEFLHGFTVPIDVGEIYYNEQEYEKDRQREIYEKKNK